MSDEREALRELRPISDSLTLALPYAVTTCWNCDYARAEEWRYCPNCGLWFMKAKPIQSVRNIHSGEVVMRLDARGE